jgi:hypothetical protein
MPGCQQLVGGWVGKLEVWNCNVANHCLAMTSEQTEYFMRTVVVIYCVNTNDTVSYLW